MTPLHRFDDRLLSDINDLARHTGWLHGAMLGFATYGILFFATLLLIGVLLNRAHSDRRLATAGWACLATLVAVGINQPVGKIFTEARPYATHPQLLVLASRTSDFSFPSDHAVMAGAAAAGLWLVSRRLGLIAVVAAVVMAFARVYIAAHYPWDVVAGLLLGALVALIGWALLRVPLTAVTGRLRQRPGLRQTFPRPGAEPTALPEPVSPGMHPA
jgi:membrane-associated phospholipid phosphatase